MSCQGRMYGARRENGKGMKKEAFLEQLGYLLSDLTEDEREEALEYYRDYLEEAGPEQEAEILARLGSPEKVAAEIRLGVGGSERAGEFTENGYRDQRFDEAPQAPDQYTQLAWSDRRKEKQENTANAGAQEDGSGNRSGRSDRGTDGNFEARSGRSDRGMDGDSKAWSGHVEWDRNGDPNDWRVRLREAWDRARASEFGRKAERAWNDARDSEWGQRAQDAWNSAHDRRESRGSEHDRRDRDERRSEHDRDNRDERRSEYDRDNRDERRAEYGNDNRRDRDSEYDREDRGSRRSEYDRGAEGERWPERRERRGGSCLLVLLLFVIFGVPLAGTLIGAGFSVIAAILGALFGIIGGLFGLICGAGAAAFGAFAAGVSLILTGIGSMISPAMGLMLIGLGFFAFALGVLCILFIRWGCVIAVPGVFRLIGWMIRTVCGWVSGFFHAIFGRR